MRLDGPEGRGDEHLGWLWRRGRPFSCAAGSLDQRNLIVAIPDYQGFMLPLLRVISAGGEHHIREVTQQVLGAYPSGAYLGNPGLRGLCDE